MSLFWKVWDDYNKSGPMPKDRKYLDALAQIGRPFKAPESEMSIDAQPSSRSLFDLAKFDKQARIIRAEVKRGELRLDLGHVLGDKIRINKRNAIKFAKWILNTYDDRKDTSTKRISRRTNEPNQ